MNYKTDIFKYTYITISSHKGQKWGIRLVHFPEPNSSVFFIFRGPLRSIRSSDIDQVSDMASSDRWSCILKVQSKSKYSILLYHFKKLKVKSPTVYNLNKILFNYIILYLFFFWFQRYNHNCNYNHYRRKNVQSMTQKNDKLQQKIFSNCHRRKVSRIRFLLRIHLRVR